MRKLFKVIVAIMLCFSLGSFKIEANNELSYDDINYSEFNLADWDYVEDSDGSIILNYYRGLETRLEIPGQLSNRKQVIYNVNYNMNTSLEHLAFKAVNNIKVGTTNKLNFNGLRELTTLDLSGLDTSNVEDMSDLFSGIKLQLVNLEYLNTSNVTNFANAFSEFAYPQALTLTFDTSKAVNMQSMFERIEIPALDISSFDTSNVENMALMFLEISLTSLDITNFNTSNVTSMSGMFAFSKVASLDLSHFNTSKVEACDYLFHDSEIEVINISNSQFNCANYDSFSELNNTFIDFSNVKLGDNFDASTLFNNSDEVLIMSRDPLFINYHYVDNNIKSMINYGIGEDAYFADGSTINNVAYYVIPSYDLGLINEQLNALTKDFKIPTHNNEKYHFAGWELILRDEHTFVGQVARTYVPIWNSHPTLLAEDYSIISNKTFDPLAYASAHDEQEGDISHNITVLESNVNAEVAGNYQITYYIKDKDGLSDTKQVNVEVKQPLIPINQVPVIDAENVVVHAGDTYNPLTNVSASDKEDGNITDDLEVVANNVNNNKPGEYQVTYQVSDSQGATTKKTIEVYVNAKPQLAVRDIELIQGSKFDLNHISANDHEDGDISHTINYEVFSHDIPEVDTNKVDTYHVEYSVQDSHGALVTKQAKVVVKAKPTTPDIENPEEPKPDIEDSKEPNEDKEEPNTVSNNNLLIYIFGLLMSLGSIYYILEHS